MTSISELYANWIKYQINLKFVDKETVETNIKNLSEQNVYAVIVFEKDIDLSINNYLSGVSSNIPNIEIYYDETITESSAAYSKIMTIVEFYRVNKFIEKELSLVYADKLSKNDTPLVRRGEINPVYYHCCLKSGKFVQGCITYLPLDYTGERSAYFTHTLVFDDDECKQLLINNNKK